MGRLNDTALDLSQQVSKVVRNGQRLIATGLDALLELALAEIVAIEAPSTRFCSLKEGSQYFAEEDNKTRASDGVRYGGVIGI